MTDKTFVVGETSKVWLDKRVRIFIGFENIRDGMHWYKLGTYMLNTFNYSFSETDASLSISCEDLMCSLNGTRGGDLPALEAETPMGTSIRQAIIDTVTQLGGVKKYRIDDVVVSGQSATVPYDLKFSDQMNVAGIIDKLATLYPAYEYFFDEDGVFIFQAIPTCVDDDIVLDNQILQQLVVDENSTVDITTIKNHIVVYGETKSDGIQIKGEFYNDNPNSPFSVSKLGHIYKIMNNESTKQIPTNDLANQRASYECWLATNLTDTINLNLILVPWLKVNQKIRYLSRAQNEEYDYIIKRISKNFSEGTVTVEAMRFYPLYPFIV
ncbi:MAG: DUF5048 domain-containing protein [Oscillospiraceae bacterium]